MNDDRVPEGKERSLRGWGRRKRKQQQAADEQAAREAAQQPGRPKRKLHERLEGK